MKILFVGLGSIGKKHSALLNRHFPEHKLFALRSERTSFQTPYFIEELSSWTEVDKIAPQIAFICNPTYLHIDTAIKCAFRSMHLFIEKPLSANLTRLDALQNVVDNKNLTAYIAYPFRHHSGLKRLKKRISDPEWGAIVCSTDFLSWGKPSYSFDPEKGGGALLELSHEIDLVEYLFGKFNSLQINRVEYDKRGVDTKVILEARYDQAHVDILLDMVSPFDNYRVVTYYSDGRLKSTDYAATDTMYVEQLKFFFNNLGNPRLENNLIDASDLFKKIIECRRK